jgi:hypothetical protein
LESDWNEEDVVVEEDKVVENVVVVEEDKVVVEEEDKVVEEDDKVVEEDVNGRRLLFDKHVTNTNMIKVTGK